MASSSHVRVIRRAAAPSAADARHAAAAQQLRQHNANNAAILARNPRATTVRRRPPSTQVPRVVPSPNVLAGRIDLRSQPGLFTAGSPTYGQLNTNVFDAYTVLAEAPENGVLVVSPEFMRVRTPVAVWFGRARELHFGALCAENLPLLDARRPITTPVVVVPLCFAMIKDDAAASTLSAELVARAAQSERVFNCAFVWSRLSGHMAFLWTNPDLNDGHVAMVQSYYAWLVSTGLFGTEAQFDAAQPSLDITVYCLPHPAAPPGITLLACINELVRGARGGQHNIDDVLNKLTVRAAWPTSNTMVTAFAADYRQALHMRIAGVVPPHRRGRRRRDGEEEEDDGARHTAFPVQHALLVPPGTVEMPHVRAMCVASREDLTILHRAAIQASHSVADALNGDVLAASTHSLDYTLAHRLARAHEHLVRAFATITLAALAWLARADPATGVLPPAAELVESALMPLVRDQPAVFALANPPAAAAALSRRLAAGAPLTAERVLAAVRCAWLCDEADGLVVSPIAFHCYAARDAAPHCETVGLASAWRIARIALAARLPPDACRFYLPVTPDKYVLDMMLHNCAPTNVRVAPCTGGAECFWHALAVGAPFASTTYREMLEATAATLFCTL